MLEKTTAQFIQRLESQGAPAIYTLTPEQAREVLTKVQSEPIEKLPIDSQEYMITDNPLGEISLTIIRPHGNTETLPALMYFHGGGWILGNKHTHDRLIRELAWGANCAVIFVNYTPSPEARYPIALEQAYAATNYIAQYGAKLHIDSSRLAVAGDSVGGNMATVVTLLAKERGGPAINYQVLFYPVTDAGLNTESYKQFAEGPWLTAAAMQWFWEAYEPQKSERTKITLSPLRASLEQLSKLPPALIITAENDVLRDEGEAYAHRLMQAGVEVKALRCLGTIHDFAILNALAYTPAAQLAVEVACTELALLFL